MIKDLHGVLSDDSRFAQVFEQKNGNCEQKEHDYFYLNENGLYFCQQSLLIMKKQRAEAKDSADTQVGGSISSPSVEEQDNKNKTNKVSQEDGFHQSNPATRVNNKSTLLNSELLRGFALLALSVALCCTAAFYLQKNYDQKKGESIALVAVAAVFLVACASIFIVAAKEKKEGIDVSQVVNSTGVVP